MTKPLFETRVRLDARLSGVECTPQARESGPAAAAAAEMDALVQAEKARQEKKEREEIERVLNNLIEAAASLRAQQQESLEEMQRLTIDLAVAIASRLLHEQIEAGKYPIAKLVRQVIERLDTSRAVTVSLHPADLELLQARLGEGRTVFPEKANVQLLADTKLARGDVRAQAGDISVLADLEEQLADIHRNLKETLPLAVQGDQDRPELRRFETKRQSA